MTDKYFQYNFAAKVFLWSYQKLLERAKEANLDTHIEELDKMQMWVNMLTIPVVEAEVIDEPGY